VIDPAESGAFVDYYEMLQLSPNADEDTIQRVFRHFAKKYHPDGSSQGDPERFNRLLDAYRTLTDPARRAAYDATHQAHWKQAWRVADEASAGNIISDDARLRERLLSLFYVQRRRDMRRPGIGEVELERLLDTPFDQLAFHLWYLREKGWIQRLDNGHLAITADGVDKFESTSLRLERDRLIESRVSESPSR
jgi:curved DNA-binding protein CbpA